MILGVAPLDNDADLCVGPEDRIIHMDYSRENGDDVHSPLPTFWYYGVQRNYHAVKAEQRDDMSVMIEIWRLPTSIKQQLPTAERRQAQLVGQADLRGLLGNRCWLDPSCTHFYALYVYHHHTIPTSSFGVPTTTSTADGGEGTVVLCSDRETTQLMCRAIRTENNIRVGLFQLKARTSEEGMTGTLTRRNFCLSAQPIIGDWLQPVQREHIHFVSDSEAILCIGQSEWLDNPEEIDACGFPRTTQHLRIRTHLYRIHIDQERAVAYVCNIELPELPIHFALTDVEDRQIYVYVNSRETSATATPVIFFYAITLDMKVLALNEHNGQWEEADEANLNRTSIVSKNKGYRRLIGTSMRFDLGLLLSMKGMELAFLQLLLSPDRSYRYRRLIRSTSTIEKIDKLGAVIHNDCLGNDYKRCFQLFPAPPLVMPLSFLACWCYLNKHKNDDDYCSQMQLNRGIDDTHFQHTFRLLAIPTSAQLFAYCSYKL